MTSTDLYNSRSLGSEKAAVSGSKSERVLDNFKEPSGGGLYSDEKAKKIDLSGGGDNHRSVPKSSTKQQVLAYSAKKAPVFVYHETKST